VARFLHTADWQIGRHSLNASHSGRARGGRFAEDDAALLAEARFTAIERIAALATAEQVDAVLVAGDLFDAQTVADKTIRRTFQAMAAYKGNWIVIPGNHDAALAESVWTRAQRLAAIPANVQLLLQPEPVLFADQGFAVLPAPLTQRQTYHDLTDWFDDAQTPAHLLRIGLAHGSVEGQLPESADSPNPIAADRAQTARLDYLALGDWHGTKQINPRTWYSGTPEQERFKDNGAGQVLMVDIDQPGAEPKVTQHAIGQHQWIKREVTLAVDADLDNLLTELQQVPDKSVVDLTIHGQINLQNHQRLWQILGDFEARQRCLQSDLSQLRLYPTADDIAALHADGYVGEVIEELRQQQASHQSSGQSNGQSNGQANDSPSDAAETAREALAILADMLRQQTAEVSP
jgi:DNA repair exonuclease SbcCD nuclease subunit